MDDREERIERLASARRKDVEARRARVQAAVRNLRRLGRPINRSSVARAAGVHRNFLGRHADLGHMVDAEAAKSGLPAGQPNTRSAVTDASLRADLAFEKQQVKTFERKVATLERRLSAAGPPGGLDGVLVDTEALYTELATVRATVADRDQEIASLREDLEAVREANRQLGRQLTDLINDGVFPEPNPADAGSAPYQRSSGAMQ